MKNSREFDQLISREDFQNDLMNFDSFTRKEKEEFQEKFDLDKESFIKAKSIIEGLNYNEKQFSETELNYLWNQLDVQINPPKVVSYNFAFWLNRIAAILVLPLLIASLWMYFNPIESYKTADFKVVTPLGTRTQFNLPDGTTGWLNNGSSLRYKSTFLNDREVELIGEAYFEVTHHDNKNFVVNTSDFSVEVLGTKFNVSAYAEDIEASVVLAEGKVKISSRKNKLSEILKPDEKFSINRLNKTASIKNVNSDDHTVWRDGYLKFRNEPLSEVLKKMERWYNVDFQISDEKLLNYKFRANFHDEPVEEILRMISITTPISYQIEERLPDRDGAFKKKKITIEAR